jgi:sterol desaturase/sphingolipid hydroxylase (fatty acid hydroxylase superfamily)
LATARGHPLDEAVNVALAALPSFVLGDSHYAAALVAALYLYPYLAHANARLDLPGLGLVLMTPRFHHWHYADDPAAVNRNFGAILSVWDHLLGSAYCPATFPSRYGIGKPLLADGSYLTHLLSPRSRGSGIVLLPQADLSEEPLSFTLSFTLTGR